MFLSSDDIQEIRIFRSRLLRLTEHRIVCPDYLCHEIAQIVNETLTVRKGEMELFQIDLSIAPMVRYFISKDVDFEQESFVNQHKLNLNQINRIIEILGDL